MADSDGHSRPSQSASQSTSQSAATSGSSSGSGSRSGSASGSKSYSSWFQTSPGLSAAGSLGSEPGASGSGGSGGSARDELGRRIARRRRVSWGLGLVLALGFATAVTPLMTAELWLPALGVRPVAAGRPAEVTVRAPPFAGVQTREVRLAGGGVIIARGEVATPAQVRAATLAAEARPRGAVPYAACFGLAFVLAAIFSHHMRRSTRGRLLRVQLVSLVSIAALAAAVKLLMLGTAVSILAVPIALFAMVPTMVLDRVAGLATGILAALVTSLLVPFDVSVAILLLVQAAAAGLLVAEGPKRRGKAVAIAGLATMLLTAATLVLIAFLTRNAAPQLGDPLHAPWLAAALGPAVATVLAVPVVPLYQLLAGEITRGRLVDLEDLSHPLLKQIAERAPGTWQHSLMMANMAEIAANAIGADGRLVRVGAYFHDLGKSLRSKYFIENLEPGETSPHDQLPPEASCEAIFAHVSEGVALARREGLHERIVDFMHMHHGNGVLEYFWGKAQEQGNPRGLAVEQFCYPGHPPQSRETAILAICDAVEAASRTLRKPEPAAIDALVQRIVYGKLHLGQLDESGLSMADLRRVSDSLRETIRHANHGRIEYPWQRAREDASASAAALADHGTQPRLDSLDRTPVPARAARPPAQIIEDAEASGERPRTSSGPQRSAQGEEAYADTADVGRAAQAVAAGRGGMDSLDLGDDEEEDLGIVATAPLAQPQPAPLAQALAQAQHAAPAAQPPGEITKVGRAPAPLSEPGRGPRETQRGRPPTTDDLETPILGAAQGQLARPEVPAVARAMPASPTTVPGHQPPAQQPAGGRAGLAARVEASLKDEWAIETPVVPPTRAELRALLGAPDPTRQQSLVELEALHRAVEELPSEPGVAPPPPPRRAPQRAPHPTSEVDPDQIEAAIEVLPPARRAPTAGTTTITGTGTAKPKKPR